MTKILLTGATGFIGRHCLPLLMKYGAEVHACSSKPPSSSRWGEHWHQLDLMNPLQVAELLTQIQATHLLHLAWYTGHGKYWTSIENFRWVQASLGLLFQFANNGGQRIVATGTCAEYDWKFGYHSEKVTPLLPTTIYGTCKHAFHLMLEAFAQQTGLSSAWGRIFFVYGPYESPQRLVPSVICSMLQGVPALCSHGNQIRDFLYVADVAAAAVSLLFSEVQGPVNIASGLPVSLKDIVGKIGEMLNHQELIRWGEIPVAPTDPSFLVADVRRLTQEVGWKPSFGLETGLKEAIKYWQRQIKD